MYVIKITKSPDELHIDFYSPSLSLLGSESFSDMQSLNFYLQALGKQHEIGRALAVIHDRQMNSVALHVLPNSDSLYFD